MTTKLVDCIDCHTVAELMAAIENFGMALDLDSPMRVSLVEGRMSDGSTVENVRLEVLPCR